MDHDVNMAVWRGAELDIGQIINTENPYMNNNQGF